MRYTLSKGTRFCALGLICFVLFAAPLAIAAESGPRSSSGGKADTAPVAAAPAAKPADSKPADAATPPSTPPASSVGTTTPAAPAPTTTAPPASPAATPASNAIRVAVEMEGTDTIGARLSFQMKEVFNASNLFSLTDADAPKIVLLLSTEPEFSSRPAVGSAYSAVWAFYQGSNTFSLYLAREVGTVGPEGVGDLALRLAERTRGLAAKFSYLLNK